MKIKKITMVLKRTQYQTVEVSEAEGFEMPENARELISMAEQLKQSPLANTNEADWDSPSDVEIVSFDVED